MDDDLRAQRLDQLGRRGEAPVGGRIGLDRHVLHVLGAQTHHDLLPEMVLERPVGQGIGCDLDGPHVDDGCFGRARERRFDQVHCRRADEAGHEDVLRVLVQLLG